jgi:benzoate membrane transport protein
VRASLLLAPLVATLVGFGGTVALVVAAAEAVGAGPEATASWVAALAIAKAGVSLVGSLRHRIPVLAAWSTPGAALIAASPGLTDLEGAVGAFLLCALLLLATATFRPLGRLVEAIPPAVAAAMLAGILLRFAIGLFDAAGQAPGLVLPLLALFFLLRLASPSWAVLAILAGGLGLAAGLGSLGALPGSFGLTPLVWVSPRFDPAVLLGLGVPLFLVTMAGQNLPGFAVLKAAGYPVPTGSLLALGGLASLLTAPFGAHATNLAAITAAICTGPEAHPDPAERWRAGVVYALWWLLLAAFAGTLALVVAALPPVLVATVAGTALLGPLAGALAVAWSEERHRLAAVVTLAASASGLVLFGIGPAFWGLSAGILVLGLERLARRRPLPDGARPS